MSRRLTEGRADALGVVCDARGADVAVFSEHAERIELCLFDASGRETERLTLPERTGHVRHGHVEGLRPGDRYALRAHGPWAPDAAMRFNPAKLLHDPWARALTGPVVAAPALVAAGADGGPDPRDTAGVLPLCIAAAPSPRIDPAERPATPWDRTVIYEAHVKGLTRLHPDVPEALRGTYEALGHPAIVAHLTRLGVTAIELLPVQAFMDEPRLTAMELRNYWGYNPHGFFMPEPRYLGPNGPAGLRAAIRALHEAGVEVILDVVYNHTAELDDGGPTISFRGLDDANWYLHAPDAPGGGYVNHSGCGNTLDLSHPFAQRLAVDSLRWWAETMGVDGFRFDLAPVLGREGNGFDPGAGFLDALLQDPTLAGLKLIAEPWDIGPGGHRTGAFPAPFAEWNDGFRDAVRGAWVGAPRGAQDLAGALLGSAEAFDHDGRPAWSSVNFVAAHDGATLADLTMYAERRNHANGEDNRDGHGHEPSDPMGPEGPTDDPAQRAARDRRRRALLATVFAAQGTPMLRAGDEGAQSQGGNNNVYCQDNETAWIDWRAADPALTGFAAGCARLRAAMPALRQRRFLHARERAADGLPDVQWAASEGPPDWDDPDLSALLLIVRGTAEGAETADDPPPALIAVNLGVEDAPFAPPPPGPGLRWAARLDSTAPDGAPGDDAPAAIPAGAVLIFEGVGA